MNELKIFENPEFGKIRTTEIDGKVYFHGNDIAKSLGYNNPRDAVSKHCKGVVKCDTLEVNTNRHGSDTTQTVSATFLPEGDVYRLIVKSKLPSAEKFEKWVFEEVLPSIRKHGAYMVDDVLKKALESPDFLIELATQLKAEKENNRQLQIAIEGKDREILELTPKASYYDVVMQCKDLVPIGIIAKDYGMSAKRMNQLLKDKGIQYKQSGVWMLYQKYAEYGYTSTKTSIHYDSNGNAHSDIHTQWTQKGRLFIYNTLSKDGIFPLIEQHQ